MNNTYFPYFNIKSKGFHVGIDFTCLMIQPQAEIEQENQYEIVYVPKSVILRVQT